MPRCARPSPPPAAAPPERAARPSRPSAGLLAVLLTVALAACTPRYAPPGPGPASPELRLAEAAATAEVEAAVEPEAATAEPPAHRLRFGSFRTADGLELPLRAWLPAEGDPTAVLLALHGFTDYANAFTPLGEALAPRGIAVYAYDQRGFGAGPNPGLWSGDEVLAGDLRAAAAELRARHPDRPLLVLGESMGGAVVLAAEATPPGLEADGLILSAPAVWARRTQPWYQRAGLWLALRTMPWLRPSGRNLDRQASDNIEMLRALGRDPLVQRSARIDTLAGLVDLMDGAFAAGPRVETPTLLLYGEKDEIIPSGPVERLWEAMPRDRGHRYLRYPEGWHLLTRDLQAAVVIEDIAAWIEDPRGPLPSGAEWRPSPAAGEAASGDAAAPAYGGAEGAFAGLSPPAASANVRPRAGP